MEGKSLIEKVEKIKPIHRFLILFGTVTILAGLFLWLIYLPKVHDIGTTKKEIASLRLKLNRAKIRARNLNRLEAECKEVNEQFQEALKLLPNKREIPSLLKTITQLGNSSHLQFLLFKPNKERQKEFYVEIPFDIKLKGSFRNVVSFFLKVGQMERIVNILDVSMVPEKPLSTTLITRCKAVTYRFKEIRHGKGGSKKRKR